MSGTITLYTHNILETSTVDVTGDPDTGYPEERLFDRSAALLWKDTVTEAKTFHVDQGAADIKDVDLLYIAGHNFDGEDLTWEYSDNDADWTPAVTGWTQDGNDPIVKTLSAAATHRYWRVTVTSMDNPMCGEILMSLGRSFQVLGKPRPVEQPKGNVKWQESIGGLERSIKLGPERRGWNYELRFNSSTILTSFKAAMEDLDDLSKPFLLYALNGEYFLARRLADPGYEYEAPLRYYERFVVMEVF